MSQRNSGYKRKKNDEYFTPEWVTKALIPYIPSHVKHIWEPAAGNGKIVNELRKNLYDVTPTDITNGKEWDFLKAKIEYPFWHVPPDAIITNPPFNQAQEFIEHALNLIRVYNGMVAMLLRTDYDSAKTRRHLFGDNKVFTRKIILTRRIIWFPKKGAAPSYNHAWYIWDYNHMPQGAAPVMSYYYDP